jgi:Flp pilus assembly pilin Flp
VRPGKTGDGALVVPRLPSSRRRHSRRHQEGQGLVEYSLILLLIAIVVTLVVVGKATTNLFSNVSNAWPH